MVLPLLAPPPQTGLMFLSTGVDIHLLCHISLQGFPPDPSFWDYWEFTAHVTCSVGAIIAMKERYGQLKGESSDWLGEKLLGFQFYTSSGLFLSPPSLFSPPTLGFILFHFSRAKLLTWHFGWHMWQIFFFFFLPPPDFDWLHMWGVTLSQTASLVLIQSSYVCAEFSWSHTRKAETSEGRKRKRALVIISGMVMYCDVTPALTEDQIERSRCMTIHLHACTEQTGVEIRTQAGHPWQMGRLVRHVCMRREGTRRRGRRYDSRLTLKHRIWPSVLVRWRRLRENKRNNSPPDHAGLI